MNPRVLALGVALAMLVPGSSAAAAGEIGLSPDGVTWSDQLPGPLFDDAVRWVPGDVRTASFHVRNRAADDGRLAIAVETVGPGRLVEEQTISLAARAGAGQWVALHQVDQRFSIGDATLAGGAPTRVEVRAAFDPSSTNESQRESVALRFRVVLSEAIAAPPGPPDPDSSTDPDAPRPPGGPEDVPDGRPDGPTAGLLPDTGAPAFGWLLILAAVLLGAGAALLRSKRGETHG